jgi:glycerophosphoryl diester phosphodiesterase
MLWLLRAPLLTILLLSSCAMPIPPPPIPEFDLQGHRGARGLLPENAVEGFLHALELGVTTLEMDVVISADSQIVVSHEPWFSHEICSRPDGSEIGPEDTVSLFSLPYDSIRLFDCGKKGHPRFPGQRPQPAHKPLLRDVVKAVRAFCRKNHRPMPWFNIETKCSPEWEQKGLVPAPEVFVQLLHEEVVALGIRGFACIQSFDVRTLQVLNEIDHGMTCALLVENDKPMEFQLSQLGFVPPIYSPLYTLVDEHSVQKAHDLNMRIIPWTVNEIADMQRLKNWGVDGLISDYPDRFSALSEEVQ